MFRQFFTKPAYPWPLAVLRIGVGLTFLLQAWLVYPDLLVLYGRQGLVQGPLNDYFSSPMLPTIPMLVDWVTRLGFSESNGVIIIYITYMASLAAVSIGLGTRFMALLAWFLHTALFTTGDIIDYGADAFAQIALFYFIFMPVGSALSVDNVIFRRKVTPSSEARLSLRIWQIHLCIVYVFSGVSKALGTQWWNGEAIWRTLMLPQFVQFDMAWMASWPTIALSAGLLTLMVEIGYPVLIWIPRVRPYWMMATILMHVGIIEFLGLGIFGAVMIVFNLGAFGVSETGPSVSLSLPRWWTGATLWHFIRARLRQNPEAQTISSCTTANAASAVDSSASS